jgi:hypothetical protein
MTEFLESAEVQLKELTDLVEDCSSKFIDCMKFYKFVPKKGKLIDAKPEDFFCMWYPFCDDYKNLWKKEQVRNIRLTYITFFLDFTLSRVFLFVSQPNQVFLS